tara:strand:+ start:68 stop:667 length:600 start_codon:yes stop_codon:yes gene_type:complete
MKNILILGPRWRNINIIKKLKKKYKIFLLNKRITPNFIIKNKIDFLVSSGYPYLVKHEILKLVKVKINLHISYLPYGRGIMPNLWSFYENYPSGITIHQLSKKFDDGDIFLQKKIKFPKLNNQTLKSTHDILLKSLEVFFLSNYEIIFEGKIKPYRQDKFYKIDRYHSRLESEKLISNFNKKWDTKIKEIKDFKRKKKK